MTTSERIEREVSDRQTDRQFEFAGRDADKEWNGGTPVVLPLTAEQAAQLDEMLANWDPAPTGA